MLRTLPFQHRTHLANPVTVALDERGEPEWIEVRLGGLIIRRPITRQPQPRVRYIPCRPPSGETP
jgi:hypothetical protein